MYWYYFIIAIAATGIGALTGMGGGVIIKPVLDVLQDFDVATIGLLSSLTVLAMAVVSVGKQAAGHAEVPWRTAVPLAVGSVIGGWLGQFLFEAAVSGIDAAAVTVIQNGILMGLVLAVFFYMHNRGRIASPKLSGAFSAAAAGVFLGVCSSFLGIGGGPINVALIVFLFDAGTKQATVCSLVTILFAQLSKLGSVLTTGGFAGYDLSALPFMIAGAVAGGFIGAALNQKFSEKSVEKAFDAAQLLVAGMAVINILRNLQLG